MSKQLRVKNLFEQSYVKKCSGRLHQTNKNLVENTSAAIFCDVLNRVMSGCLMTAGSATAACSLVMHSVQRSETMRVSVMKWRATATSSGSIFMQ